MNLLSTLLVPQRYTAGVPLFALAIEQMVILLHSLEGLNGISVGPLQERISLYADYTLLYLRNDRDSLGAALSIIYLFGRFSGLY